MSTLKNIKFKKIVGWLLVILFGSFLLRMYEIPNPQQFQTKTKRYASITGFTKIVDAESGNGIFFYSDNGNVYPIEVEKTAEDEWKVTFKKSKN